MLNLKISIIRLLLDVLYAVLLFFLFMCGVHYGSEFLGLYFWYVRVGLGISFVGLGLLLTRWIKTALFGTLKSISIYGLCREDCHTVFGAFYGVTTEMKASISIPILNKVIRETLDYLFNGSQPSKGQEDSIEGQESQEGHENSQSMAGMDGVAERFNNLLVSVNENKLFQISKSAMVKAYDYVDECILGYCYAKVNDEKSVVQCALEAFVIFAEHSLSMMKKVMTVVTFQFMLKVAFWACYCIGIYNHFYFGIDDVPATLLNVLVFYVIGKLILGIVEDSILEPFLMYSIVGEFSKIEWDDSLAVKIEEMVVAVPALKKLQGMDKKRKKSHETDDVDELAETPTDESGPIEDQGSSANSNEPMT